MVGKALIPPKINSIVPKPNENDTEVGGFCIRVYLSDKSVIISENIKTAETEITIEAPTAIGLQEIEQTVITFVATSVSTEEKEFTIYFSRGWHKLRLCTYQMSFGVPSQDNGTNTTEMRNSQ